MAGEADTASGEARLLVVDDEPNIVELLSASLRFAGFEVASAADGQQALKLVESFQPELVVLDVMMPGIDGFEVVRRMRGRQQLMPVLFLTARDATEDKIAGLTIGADDYITKPFSHLELLARVRAVLRRYQNQLPALGEVFESGDLRIDFASRHVTVKGHTVRLTPTEYSLLFHLTRNAGRVLPHQTLLAKVWGREYTDEIDYLKVYIRRLRQKLETDTSAIGTIVSERGVGYKFVQA